jgi:hypothetical protein
MADGGESFRECLQPACYRLEIASDFSLFVLGTGVREKHFARDAPDIGLLYKDEEIRISSSAPISDLKPGHSGIPGILDANDPGFETLGRPTLLDDRAELLHCPFDGFAAVGAGYSRRFRKRKPQQRTICGPRSIDVMLERRRDGLQGGEALGFLFGR